MVTSSAELDIRGRLAEHDVTTKGDVAIMVPAGVLRSILRDLDMWRSIGTRELELIELELARRVAQQKS